MGVNEWEGVEGVAGEERGRGRREREGWEEEREEMERWGRKKDRGKKERERESDKQMEGDRPEFRRDGERNRERVKERWERRERERELEEKLFIQLNECPRQNVGNEKDRETKTKGKREREREGDWEREGKVIKEIEKWTPTWLSLGLRCFIIYESDETLDLCYFNSVVQLTHVSYKGDYWLELIGAGNCRVHPQFESCRNHLSWHNYVGTKLPILPFEGSLKDNAGVTNISRPIFGQRYFSCGVWNELSTIFHLLKTFI